MQIINQPVLENAFRLLPTGTKQKLLLLIIFQILTSILDLLALFLLGSVISVGFAYIQNQSANFPSRLIDLLNLESFSFYTQFLFLSLLIIAIFSGKTLLAILGNRKILIFLGNRAAAASSMMVSKLLSSSPDYILRKKTQELLFSVTAGIDNLILNYITASTILLNESLFLLVILTGVLIYSPSVGFIAIIIFTAVFLFVNRFTSRGSKSLAERSARLGISYNELLLDTFGVYRELLLRNELGKTSQEVQTVRADILRVRAQMIFLPFLSRYIFEMTIVIGGSLIGLSQLLLQNPTEAVISIITFFAASTRILPALIRAQSSFLAMKQSEGGAQVTLNVIAEIELNLRDSKECSLVDDTDMFTSSIEVECVSFSYPNTDQEVLKSISFSIQPGQFVAIVGKSGAGKSTLVDLLLGMYTPSSGQVKVSGVAPRCAIRKWPGLISYVPQDIAMIDGTISKNIALQETDQQKNRILNALQRAQLLDDVLAMNGEVNEIVGERGTRLSGGQRQRLGIARALYTNPQIIIFDEATSSLDSITEKAVTDSIYDKKNRLTLVVVAHRLSTVKNADLVIYLDEGKIVAEGTFDEVRSLIPKFDEQVKLVNL